VSRQIVVRPRLESEADLFIERVAETLDDPRRQSRITPQIIANATAVIGAQIALKSALARPITP